MSATMNHADERTQFLSFSLSGGEYAVPLLRVKEIIEYAAPTRVPTMPASVRGVINLRGRVVPVVDLAARFGLDSGEITRLTCIVIVELVDAETPLVMGIITDAVIRVLELGETEIVPAPSFGTSIDTRFIAGMAEEAQTFVIILDVDHCLDTSELSSVLTAAAS